MFETIMIDINPYYEVWVTENLIIVVDAEPLIKYYYSNEVNF